MQGDIKIRLIYSFDGSKFCGSQTQPNGKAVEDRLNSALFRCGINEKVISASRTDKGVHALSQISTTHCAAFWDLQNLRHFINRHAKPSIYVRKIERADENFQVRFDAKARSYRYILNHDEFSPFFSNYFYFYPKISPFLLNLSLGIFVGKHDFSEFMKSGSASGSVREIYKAFAYRYKNFTIINFKANGFLRAQVRLMVANALKCVKILEKSFNNKKIDEILNFYKNNKNLKFNEILKNKDFNIEKIINDNNFPLNINKAITRIPAPPNGLYLNKIWY